MPTLRELQDDFRGAILGDDGGLAEAHIVADGLAARARLRIYRRHVFTRLTAALQATYPVVCRLVDERFFAFAADQYIRSHPPTGPCLFEYGESLPDFLATFPPCREFLYLPDVARLEWAVNRAVHAVHGLPLGAEALRAAPPEKAADLVLHLRASLSLLASPWPIDRIWRANQPEADPEARVDLGAGGVSLEIRRMGDEVIFRALRVGTFAFRHALAAGRRLEVAAEAAASADPSFDLAPELAALLEEGLVTGLSLSPSTRRTSHATDRCDDE